MEKDYSPKTSEVLEEMWKESRENVLRKGKSFKESIKENIPNVRKSLKEFGEYVVCQGGIAVLLTHCIPTAKRRGRGEKGCSSEEYTSAENAGGVVGMGTSFVGQLFGYGYLAIHDHLEALLVPVATNILSKGYEIGRSAYLNTKEGLTKKHSKELSDVVQNS